MQLLLVTAACHTDPAPGHVRRPEPTTETTTPPPEVQRDPVVVLQRASMALRGVRASPEDVSRVREEPDALVEIVTTYTADPLFGETLRDMHAEHLHLRWDVTQHPPPEGPLQGMVGDNELTTMIDEAPLRLVEHLVMTGRPYTEVVTTDLTATNEILSIAYGLPFDPAGPEWQVVPWPDGRPAAGILADNNVFLRFQNAPANYHRQRANAMTAAFVCDDFSRREGLGLDVFDPAGGPEAVQETPECAACHAALDPIGSAFWGSRRWIIESEVNRAYELGCKGDLAYACYPLVMWDPALDEREELGLPPPAWYGTPVADLAELGQQMAADPRFASCAAERFWSWLTQTPLGDVPFEVSSGLAQGFVAGGYDAKQLAVAVVTHAAFEDAYTVRPEQYARFVEDLTGFRWTGTPDPEIGFCPLDCEGEVDLARNDRFGNHTILGGPDGWFVVDATFTPTPSRELALQWFAEEASAFVVDHDVAANPADRRLLVAADPLDLSDAAVDAQLAALSERILGVEDPDVAALRDLFRGAVDRAGGDAAAGWRLAIAALLLDRRTVMY